MSLIHKQRLVHRDLKPDNVLLRNPKDARAGVAIIDFGLTNERRQRLEGTLGYHAPEQASSRELNLGAAADVFALGQICHWLLTGQSVSFDMDLTMTDWDSVSFAQLQQNPRIPKGFTSLLNAALRFKPEQRPRAIDLAGAARRIRDEQPATSA